MSRLPVVAVALSVLALSVSALVLAGDVMGLRREAERAVPLGSGFTYQGRVEKDGLPVDGACDFEFLLFDDEAGGVQVGGLASYPAVPVVNGRFSLVVNSLGEFGPSPFSGDARWLETGVRCPAGSGEFETLGRTELTPTPYAYFALKSDFAETAENANALNGIPAEAYAQFENVVYVANTGDPDQNGTALIAALEGITTAASGNRFVVLVEPGLYNLYEPLQMKEYVDIWGFGRQRTVLSRVNGVLVISGVQRAGLQDLGIYSEATSGPGVLITLAGDGEVLGDTALRRLYLQSTAGTAAIAVSHRLLIEDVTVVMHCSAGSTTCIGIAGQSNQGEVVIRDSDITLVSTDSQTTVGVLATSDWRILDSDIYVQSNGTGVNAFGVDVVSAALQVALGRLRLTDTDIQVWGTATTATGVRTVSDLEVEDTSILSSAKPTGGTARGIDAARALTVHDSGASVLIGEVRIAIDFHGAFNSTVTDSKTTLNGSAAAAGSAGLLVRAGSGPVSVFNSILDSRASSGPVPPVISNASGSAVQVQFSQLLGGPVTGTATCIATSDEALVFSATGCP